MLDVTNADSRLSMQEVSRRTRKHIKTIYDWIKPEYAKGRAGRYLETAMMGGQRYTTEDALKQFLVQGPPLQQPSQHRKPRPPRVLDAESEYRLISTIFEAAGIDYRPPKPASA